MVRIIDLDKSTKKNIATTKFARIYRIEKDFVIKSIETDYVVPPHNPQSELSILKKLQGGVNIIQLLDSQTFPAENELQLLFPYYESDLNSFMCASWKLQGTKRERKFNPYIDMTMTVTHGTLQDSSQQTLYKNLLDVNKYCFDFFKQLASGIKFMHDHEIIHRDIKPQNILLQDNEDLQLVITDFGISYDMKDTKQIIREPMDGKITDVSTSFYKAPELLFSVKNYSTAVDVWSLMVIVSQWFQCQSASSTCLPSIFDDGSGILEDGGSDIRLILSIFEKVGIPSIEQWDEVSQFGSKDAFVGLFGEKGDNNYIFNQGITEQRNKILEYLPNLNELLDESIKDKFINCILGMLQLQSTKRWTCDDILLELNR